MVTNLVVERGKQVATAVGAVAGAGVAHNMANQEYKVEYKLVELLIKTDKGKLIDVIQDVDNSMLFERGDKVRILYFDNGVRVDKSTDLLAVNSLNPKNIDTNCDFGLVLDVNFGYAAVTNNFQCLHNQGILELNGKPYVTTHQ